jgi:hypothetical protein
MQRVVVIPNRRFGTTYRPYLQESRIEEYPSPLNVGPVGYPVTSAWNYHYTLRNIPEDRISHNDFLSLYIQLVIR